MFHLESLNDRSLAEKPHLESLNDSDSNPPNPGLGRDARVEALLSTHCAYLTKKEIYESGDE